MGMKKTIYTEHHDSLAIITLNRPEKKNALTYAMMDHLLREVAGLAEDDTVCAVMLRGAGDAFCAGGDLKDWRDDDPRLERSTILRAQKLRQRMETSLLLHKMPKPTLAVLQGPAVGAGLGLALACDIRIASTEATFMTGFSRLALPGDFGCNYFLSHLAGPARARELSFTSKMIDAQTALDYGLISHLVSPSEVDSYSIEMALNMAKGPTKALGHIKDIFQSIEEGAALEEILNMEAGYTVKSTQYADFKEAMLAILKS